MKKVALLMIGALCFGGILSVGAQSVLFSTENNFGPGDERGSDGAYEDSYQVRVEEGMTIEVVCRSDAVDTYIVAVLPNGERIENDDYEQFNAGFSRTITTTGTLQFTVSPLFSGDVGDYEIVVSELGEARSISLGESVNGMFGKQSSGRRADRYQYTGRAGETIVIDQESDDFDSYLEVMSSDGQEFSNDDGGEGFNSRLSYRFDRDETITIVASSLGGDDTGSYTLTVSEGAGTIAAEYRGSLDSSDPRAYDGTIYDEYEYTGRAGASIAVMASSSDFDTVVYISNPDGSNLGRDDDGGGGTNSNLNVTLPENGTYKIYVVSLFDEYGSYELTIFE